MYRFLRARPLFVHSETGCGIQHTETSERRIRHAPDRVRRVFAPVLGRIEEEDRKKARHHDIEDRHPLTVWLRAWDRTFCATPRLPDASNPIAYLIFLDKLL